MDGCVYHGSSSVSTKFGPRINENDVIGCGVDFLSQSLFFTRNGIFLGKAFEGIVPVSVYIYTLCIVHNLFSTYRLIKNF